MTIARYHTNTRMSQAVTHNNTVYLAGQVASDPAANITVQTQQVLDKIDALLAGAGRAAIGGTGTQKFSDITNVYSVRT